MSSGDDQTALSPITEPVAKYFMLQLLDALEHLHAEDVAHRNIKLDNIVIDHNDGFKAKLIDYGYIVTAGT